MAFICSNVAKKQLNIDISRRSVGAKSPAIKKSSTLKSKGRMSLSPPTTIPRGPNLQTTMRSNRR